MNLNRNHLKLPFVIGSAVVITAGTGAAAFALAGSTFVGTESGNSQPIDDNHAPVGVHGPHGHGADDATPEPRESASQSARPAASASPDRRGRGADDPADHDANDDHGGLRGDDASDDATPEPSESADDSGHHRGSGDEDRSGSDDSSPSASPTPDDHSGSGSGSDDDGSHQGGGSDDDSGHGGHGSDD